MDSIGSASPQKVGIYRSLMMPGFTDAGAGTTYVPKAVIPRRTAATSTTAKGNSAAASSNAADTNDDNDDVDPRAEETFSEAATELHDNRTNKSIISHNVQYNLQTSGVVKNGGITERGRGNTANAAANKNNNQNSSGDSIEVEATFGFFPSTKPPPSPAPRGIGGISIGGENRFDSNEKLTKTPNRGRKNSSTPLSPTPQPVSPPPVTRKQLTVKRSTTAEDDQKKEAVDTTNTTAALTTSSGDHPKVDNCQPQSAASTEHETSQKDEDNTKQDRSTIEKSAQQLPLHERPFSMRREMKREVSTFSLAPQTGAVLDREEHQAELKSWKERGARDQPSEQNPTLRIDEVEENETDSGNHQFRNDSKESCDVNDETCSDDRNVNRRLDLHALQEIDRMENQKQMKGLTPFGNVLEKGNRTKTKAKEGDELTDENNFNEELSTSSSIVSSTCSEFGTVIQMGDATMAARMKEVEEMELAALAEAPIEDYDAEHQTKASLLSSKSLLQHDASLDLPILESPTPGRNEAAATKPNRLGARLQSDAKTTAATANSTISPIKRNPTKSEIVSAAIRRVGPIHSLNTNIRGDKKIRNSLSAPTTPMRMPSVNSSKQADMSGGAQESSPSPYETASDVAGDQKKRVLSPRFASLLRGRRGGGADNKTQTDAKDVSHNLPLSPRVAISQTFQYAQKCFSYDNTLTEYSVDGDHGDLDSNETGERRRKLQEDLVIPPLEQRPSTARLTPRVMPLESSSIRNSRELRHSKSLDPSSGRRSPFRELPSSTSQRYPFLHYSFPAPTNEVTTSSSVAIPDLTSADIDLRGRINSDFSPTKYSKKTMALSSTMELQQPKRIEIEREDALDILACLVEQGIADWNTSSKKQNVDSTSTDLQNHDDTKMDGKSSQAMVASPASSSPSACTDIMRTTKEEKTEDGSSRMQLASAQKVGQKKNMNTSSSDSALHELIEDFKKWIEDSDKDTDPSSDNGMKQRQRRAEALQELVTSHAYAIEMKRASSSASTWLKSIGRGQSTSKNEILGKDEDESRTISTDATEVESSEKNECNMPDKMEMMTSKATLHRAQMELTETKKFNSMLNEELSKCRAEIGRMKSISRSDHINKSILDDADSDSAGNSVTRSHEEGQPKGTSEQDSLRSALEKANETIRRLHSDLQKHKAVDDGEDIEPAPVVDVPEIQVNESLTQSTTSTPDSTRRTVNVHMLDGENFVTEWDDLKSLPPPPDHSLQSPIVTAVLEQWTQDRSLHESLLSWMDNVMKGDDLEGVPPLMISSLNHQVRDGFTMHVLPHLLRRADIHVAVQTRTHRLTTYDMSVTVSQKRELMAGTSELPSSSSSGYLQPKDVKSQLQPSLLDRRDSMSGDEWVNRFEPRLSSAESVAHSAVTETISNLPAAHQNQPGTISDPWDQPPQTPVQTEYSEFSSKMRSRSGSEGSFDESSQHYRQRQNELNQGGAGGGTIMGALGGALSGLLSRNKYAVSPGRFHPSQARYRASGFSEDSRDNSNMLPASLRAQMDLTSSPTPGSTGYHRVGQLEATVSAAIDDQRPHFQEEPQPYHRVVSAPPGRIGVTFVEFRGHAVVSDVAADSPLADWVFPSDILIAVDEIPVSGMRVRDIITIISDRKNQQRALRVISSHAMNEFTMMSQVGGPLNEENGEDE